MEKEVIVVQAGEITFKGKQWKWRALEGGRLEVYVDETNEWKEVISLDEVIN